MENIISDCYMNIQKMRYKYNKKIAPATIGLESHRVT